MRFIDEARIEVKAGRGGPGKVSFHREKFKPIGPPNGGNGGRGGHIILKASKNLRSLLDYKYRQSFEASNGEAGGMTRCTGSDGEDLILPVPVGTLIYDHERGHIISDLSADGAELLLAKGGRGGKGNAHFCSSTMRSPRFAQPGEEGEALTIRLELKLLADVGLMGLPNAGKSSLLRAVTSAKPKVADYPFTTLNPQLGVVSGAAGSSFVMADIPGLIEGASRGTGLGLEFLRHVERSRVLFHLVDISEFALEPPLRAYELIRKELGAFKSELLSKPEWILLTKSDLCSRETCEKWKSKFSKYSSHVFVVSSATQEGLAHLLNQTSEELQKEKGHECQSASAS